MSTAANPTVTVLDFDRELGRLRIRLEGGTLAPSWEGSHARNGSLEPAYCEITIWDDELRRVSSFGGSVWPAAWPQLFTCLKGTAQYGPHTLVTDLGVALIKEALGEHGARIAEREAVVS